MRVDEGVTARDLLPAIEAMWRASGLKILAIEESRQPGDGAPVFTVNGRYTSRGWTDWTEGFVYGSALLQFDATGDERFLSLGRGATLDRMAPHVTDFGVHDHGFNNVSTYGALRRLAIEGRFPCESGERRLYDLALRCSGSVQAHRWTHTADGGFIYSFNGPHSLFADTIRSLRSLAVAHLLGQPLVEEQGRRVSLLERLVAHARSTARYTVYYGEGRDAYDVRGRVAHESIFDVNDGSYRCPSTQQGYSPFSTWTRALAWVMCGYAEELEYLDTVLDSELASSGGRSEIVRWMERAARATCDYYIASTPTDGVPYWDVCAPGLAQMPGYLDRPADPFNDFEPVDSSAAVIAAQGLVRLGHYLVRRGAADAGRYTQAGLTVARTLLTEPYLSLDTECQGLLRHSVYHRPNGWDHVPSDRKVPCGEASMWGDYHLRELALWIQREANSEPYLTFYGPTMREE